MYLIYSYQYNKELLSKGLYRGHDEELLGHYRRECLLVRRCEQLHRDHFQTPCQFSVRGSVYSFMSHCCSLKHSSYKVLWTEFVLEHLCIQQLFPLLSLTCICHSLSSVSNFLFKK